HSVGLPAAALRACSPRRPRPQRLLRRARTSLRLGRRAPASLTRRRSRNALATARSRPNPRLAQASRMAAARASLPSGDKRPARDPMAGLHARYRAHRFRSLDPAASWLLSLLAVLD